MKTTIWLTASAIALAAVPLSAATVDEGPTMKRFQPRAQGRAFKIMKRTSHITVHVAAAGTRNGGTR